MLGYVCRMAMLYDPLLTLRALGATARLATDVHGQKSVTLTWSLASRRADQRRGAAILARFARLLALQLDVPPGHKARTVQQMVASGRVRVVGGRFVLA